MKTYKTSEIAAACGIHPNTARLYEALGYLPAVPRTANGYRVYTALHLEHIRLVRTALKSTWLGGGIRRKALSVLTLSASGQHQDAAAAAREHLILVVKEREKAEMAASYLEKWASADGPLTSESSRWLKSGEVLQQLNITHDMLRSWERNGLIKPIRDTANGYRLFGETEIQRLYVIRSLRKARFSLMSIHTMLQHYDNGLRSGLSLILNELPPEEDNIFYNTNEWLSKIRSIEASALDLIRQLNQIRKLSVTI